MKKYFYSLIALAMTAAGFTASAASQSTAPMKAIEAKAIYQGEAQAPTASKAVTAKALTAVTNSSSVGVMNAPARVDASQMTWKSLGTGRFTDDCVTTLFNYTPPTVEVEIEESNEVPGYYRLVDPYKPVAADWGVSYSGKNYMYVDASNPNQVYIDGQFATGLTVQPIYGMVVVMSFAWYQMQTGGSPDAYYGTLDDFVITFPTKALLMGMTNFNDGDLYPANTNGNFKIALPGAADYSLSVTSSGCIENGNVDFTVTAGADVATVKYFLAAGSYGFNDDNYQYTAINGTALSKTSGEFSLSLNAPPAGRYTLFVAALDKDGNYASGEGTYMYNIPDDDENWTSLGTVMFGEDMVGSIYQLGPTEYEVELQENIEKPGYYRLVNPYKDHTFAQYIHSEGHNHYIFIDASDKENVILEESPIGLDLGYGMMSVSSLAAINGSKPGTMADYDDDNYKITFPQNALLFAEAKESHGAWYYANKNEAFYVMVPKPKIEVNSIAELRALELGTKAVLNAENLKVTLGDPMSEASVVEDLTGGVLAMFMTEGDRPLTGTTLSGKLACEVHAGVVGFDLDNSEVTYGTFDATFGKEIALDAVTDEANLFTLVTFYNTPDTPIEMGDYGLTIGETVIAFDLGGFIDSDDYEYPEKIESLTGILLPGSVVGADDDMILLGLRTPDDIVAAEDLTEVNSIAELKALETNTDDYVILNTEGLTVTFSQGYYTFAEDETGGTNIYPVSDDREVAEGDCLKGKLRCMSYAGMVMIDLDNSEYTVTKADVKTGKVVSAADLLDPKYENCLVTVMNTTEYPLIALEDQPGIMIGNVAVAADMFEVLPEGYNMPEKVKSVTGIVFNMDAMALDLDDDIEVPSIYLLLRNVNDIVADTDNGIKNITTLVKEYDVYNVKGVKVRNAGEGMRGLAPGIYIVGGHKILVK